MKFNEKLKELRKKKNLTQEELAEKLFVTRTAVSKWESGKGYPSIELLKELSIFYEISIDDLLSNEELIDYSIKIVRNERDNSSSLIFSLMDIFVLLLLFIPIFGQNIDNKYISVSLYNLNISILSHIAYYLIIIFLGVLGVINIITLCLKFKKANYLINYISFILSIIAISIFIIGKQPYTGIFFLFLLIIKSLIWIKAKK